MPGGVAGVRPIMAAPYADHGDFMGTESSLRASPCNYRQASGHPTTLTPDPVERVQLDSHGKQRRNRNARLALSGLDINIGTSY